MCDARSPPVLDHLAIPTMLPFAETGRGSRWLPPLLVPVMKICTDDFLRQKREATKPHHLRRFRLGIRRGDMVESLKRGEREKEGFYAPVGPRRISP